MNQQFLDLIHQSTFNEFAFLLVAAALAGAIANALKQPLIVAFILIGVISGQSVLGITTSDDQIALLAKLGISVLLFIVGLKLDLKLIRSLGGIALMVGLGQIITTVFFGALICLALRFSVQNALLVGVALSFSSTIIIIKILSDKREIDSIHGQIALGVLIVQDLAVVVSMIVLAAFKGSGAEGEEVNLVSAIFEVLISAAILILSLIVFIRLAALKVVSFMAKNQELLLCFAIAWAVMLAALCDTLGLSKELGGLLAGISLASTPYREAIISRLASLRNFLLLFFFLSLGTQINLDILGGVLVPAMVLSLFVLLFKPLIILSLCGLLGYRKRTGFLAGLSLAQISEFSLIFISMAFAAGFVDQEIFGLVTFIGLITIITSTYLISLSQSLYTWAEPFLDVFEKKGSDREKEENTGKTKRKYDVVLFGLGRYGRAMAKSFIDSGKTVLGVDFNPKEVRRWRLKGYDAVYGDANDADFYAALPLKNTDWVISALPQHNTGVTHEDPRLVIVNALKENKFKGRIAVACHREEDIEKFATLGVTEIFLPFEDAALMAAEKVVEEEEKKD